jgi:hypothetical protein
MSKFTRFNRHELMKADTLTEIMSIKRSLWTREDIKFEQTLENMLSGLMDGYLYENLILEAQKLPVDLYERLTSVYFICKDYPISETKVF